MSSWLTTLLLGSRESKPSELCKAVLSNANFLIDKADKDHMRITMVSQSIRLDVNVLFLQ